MQRPPKPLIKSTKIFPYNNFRKILTPDGFLQQLQSCLAEQPIKSLRDVLITTSTGLHSSLNHAQNMQYLQINKKNQTTSINVHCSIGLGFGSTNNIVSGRSFKIRNFGHNRAKAKENAIPVQLKPPKLLTLGASEPVKTQQGGIQFIKLHPYPHHFHPHQIGNKVYLHKLNHDRFESSTGQFSKWAVIISQSLFYGSFLSQTNLLKLKYLIQNLQKHHKNLSIILRLHSQRDLNTIITTLTQKQLPLSCIIWAKYRYFETINLFDLTQVAQIYGFQRYVVIEDSYEIIKSVYYQCAGKAYQLEKKQMETISDKHIDYSCKYLYLKFEGLPNFVRFSQKFRIYCQDDQICTEKRGYQDDTEALYKLEQLNEKIRISTNKRILKTQKYLSRKISQPQNTQTRPQSSQKQAQIDKNEQLRQKMLQFSKMLQQTHKRRQSVQCNRNRNSNKSLKSAANKRSQTPTQNNNSTSNINGNGGKNCQQIVMDLLKNNMNINKQINKFREKVQAGFMGTQLR